MGMGPLEEFVANRNEMIVGNTIRSILDFKVCMNYLTSLGTFNITRKDFVFRIFSLHPQI